MSSSTHQIAVKGVDKTGAAFQSIQARAVAAGRRISSVMGGAIAAAGAYLSIRSIKSGIDQLGTLSDLAMKAGTSVDTLTKSALAFQVAGLNLPVETLAKSFQYLKKNTGEGGMDNFYKVAESIAKIEDPAQRGAALVKNFGRAGMELQPLIDGGEQAIQKMKTLTEIMPGVSQAAADAGDAAADSLAIFGKGAHNLFLKVVGNIAGMWAEDFPGGIRAGALNAINAIEWFCKKAFAYATKWGAIIGNAFNAIWNFAANGYTWEQAWSEFGEVNDILNNQMDSRLDAIDKARENYKKTLSEISVDDLANAFGGPKGRRVVGEEIGAAAAKAATRITNQLVMGGSNEARKLGMLGPQFQNEQKKTNQLLQKVVDNTAKTAENTDEDGLAVTNLE